MSLTARCYGSKRERTVFAVPVAAGDADPVTPGRPPFGRSRPFQEGPVASRTPRRSGGRCLRSSGSAYGIRTRVTAVRGRRPRPLDECATSEGIMPDPGGWGRRIRTPATGARTRRPTARRSPNGPTGSGTVAHAVGRADHALKAAAGGPSTARGGGRPAGVGSLSPRPVHRHGQFLVRRAARRARQPRPWLPPSHRTARRSGRRLP